MTAVTQPAAFEWSEGIVIRAICRQVLRRKCLLLVDNCNWTGHECDVLGVTQDLRIIDVEVKISRADFRADAKKDKWWHRLTYAEAQARGVSMWERGDRLQHPPRVWKHYYAMPATIWRPEMLSMSASPASGVILLHERGGLISARVERRSKPNVDAQRITATSAIDIARLANLRMWESSDACWRANAEIRQLRAELNPACSEALQRSRGGLFAGHAA